MSMLFLSIILVIGALTTFTDLKSKKIYNQHLIIGAVMGIIAIVYTAIFRHEDVFSRFTNGLVAFPIGFVLYRTDLWKGGDAKLFMLYAFLMPPSVTPNHLPFPSVTGLFACSFIAGVFILLPVLIKDIIINNQVVMNDLFSARKRQALVRGTIKTVVYSWALFPIYYLIKFVKIPLFAYFSREMTSPTIVSIAMFLIFSAVHKIKRGAERHFLAKFFKKYFFEFTTYIAFGFLMRLLLAPDSLSFPSLKRYFIIIILSNVISCCIHTTYNHFKSYQERFPFAPLLFLGCILSYSPFLSTLTHAMTRWNALQYH